MGTVLGVLAACYTIGSIIVFKVYRRDPKAGANIWLCLTAAVLWGPLILALMIIVAIVEVDHRMKYRKLQMQIRIPHQVE